MPLMIFSVILIFTLVCLGYVWATSLSVETLETLLEDTLPVIAGCLVVTITIISFIIINF